jgi:hypothetical protein
MILNLEQICRLAAYQAAEVRQAGTLGPAIPVAILRAWANDANVEAEKLIRQVREDYFMRVMNSLTDVTAQKIRGIDYTPSVSLPLLTTSQRVSLPPDFLTLKSIRAVTPGMEGVKLEHLDMAHAEFQALLKIGATNPSSGGGGVFYDIIGDRTLWFVPALTAQMDIELVYIARTAMLNYYATGTLTVTDATKAVTGAGGALWSSGSPFDAAYLDLVTGVSASATIPTPDPAIVYDGGARHRVAAIATDTTLTLASNKVGTVAAGTGYFLSSLPQVPEEAHTALADFVTARILATLGAGNRAEWFMGRFNARVGGIVTSAARRQVADAEVTEDYNPGGY